MFEKKLVLKFVTPTPTGSFREHRAWFERCVEKYNEKGRESTVNLKKIQILEISADKIQISLQSEVNLEKAPGRALTYLSRLLVTEPDGEDFFDPFYAENLFHGKLFSTSEMGTVDAKISDEDVVKILLDYTLTPQSSISESRKKAFKKIKKIVEEEILPLKKEKKEGKKDV